MQPISYARRRFPPDVIRRAVWFYLRFTLSYRDVEDLLAERGLQVSNETVRRWVLKFGPLIARNLRRGRPTPHAQWHLDEMVVSIAGRRMYLWRAVDSEGEVLDVLVQPRRDTAAALKLLRSRRAARETLMAAPPGRRGDGAKEKPRRLGRGYAGVASEQGIWGMQPCSTSAPSH